MIWPFLGILFCPAFFPCYLNIIFKYLNNKVSELDVKKIFLFLIRPHKAPGPNGYPASFYQNCWNICGKDIISIVQHCFRSSSPPLGLGDTLIALVLKVEGPQLISQFRLISLCCTLYKVVTKLLVEQLRPILTNIVGHSKWVSFLVDISQIICVSSRSLPHFSETKGKNGYTAWKIDLIMYCVTQVNFQILMNSELS